PLFPINHTNARLRHFLARLRRRTWCVTKKRAALQAHLDIAILWSNFCRGITNRTGTSPAQALALTPRRYRPEEVLAWRQDWGPLSPPLPARPAPHHPHARRAFSYRIGSDAAAAQHTDCSLPSGTPPFGIVDRLDRGAAAPLACPPFGGPRADSGAPGAGPAPAVRRAG